MNDLSRTHLERLQNRVEQSAKALQPINPPFELNICWSEGYDELFRQQGIVTAEAEVLARAEKDGRVILAGRGGAGKTQLLLRVLQTAVRNGSIVVLVRLQQWEKEDYDRWKQTTRASVADGAAFLIERFGTPATSVMELDWLPPTSKKILIVDGLNEVSTSLGVEILQALDELTRNQIGTSALVADRLVRRELAPPMRWNLGLVLPLSAEAIAKFSDRTKAVAVGTFLLDSPFFLNAALKEEPVLQGGALTHQQYFLSHSGLNGMELDRVAAAAFRAYRESRARTFSLRSFLESTDSTIVERLVNSGILIRESDDAAHFAHHLLHDFLVARYVAGLTPAEWTHRTLEIMTLEQSSFDPVALAFEHLGGGRADDFLRSLYDWNLYATGYALGESANGPVAPSLEMRTVIYAMLAEKRFDLVLQTRRRATDALLMIGADTARRFVDAANLESILRDLGNVTTVAPWFQEWRDLFTRSGENGLAAIEVDALGSADSVIGWTAANVARRMILTDSQLEKIRGMLSGAAGTIRWRIAHVLGAFPSRESFATLVQLLDDPSDQLVQYGALRSLTEMAARSSSGDLRGAIIEELLRRIDWIEKNVRFREELARVLIIDPRASPPDWKHVVARFAREFFVRTDDPVQQDRWRAYVANVEACYRNEGTAAADVVPS